MKFDNQRKNHLKSKVIIDTLFSHGKVITQKPFRLVYNEISATTESGIQLLISVPKRRFKLAVSRNRIRRMTSEIFRLNGGELQQLITNSNKQYAVGIIYIGSKELPHAVMEKQLLLIIMQLAEKIKASNT